MTKANRRKRLREVLSENIRLFRFEKKMTQTTLATLAGCSQGTISQIEKCGNLPNLESLLGISLALGTTPARLFIDVSTVGSIDKELSHLPIKITFKKEW